MNNNSSDSSRNGGSNIKIQNFLEALRNSQNRPAGSEVPEGRPHNPFAEFQAKKEIEKKRAEQFHQARQQEWNKVFSATERQTEQKIEQIREQLRQLAKQMKRLNTNIVKAIEAPIVSGAGESDEGFLNHLHRQLRLFSLNANKTNSWLETYQSRSIRKGVYWGMAKSKGSSYTQNNERAVATSIG